MSGYVRQVCLVAGKRLWLIGGKAAAASMVMTRYRIQDTAAPSMVWIQDTDTGYRMVLIQDLDTE